MTDTCKKDGYLTGDMPCLSFNTLPVKIQIGFIEYQHGTDIFFQYLSHKTFYPADIEIIIKALYYKCLIDIRSNGLFIGNRPAFLTIQCPFTEQHINYNPFIFIERLKEAVPVPVVTADERCTTLEAHRVLIEGNMRREKRKQYVDSIAATYILEGYLKKNKE